MKKCMLLLLLIVSPFGVCAMESVSLSPMQEVQKSKDEFKEQLEQLQLTNVTHQKIMRISKMSLQEFIHNNVEFSLAQMIHEDPVEFLIFCYNLLLHDRIIFKLSDLMQDESLLNKCKKVRINGYSALGAAIVTEEYKQGYFGTKYSLIEELLTLGFRLTKKDKMAAAFVLYPCFSSGLEKRTMLLLNTFPLPYDVKEIIIGYIMDFLIIQEQCCSWFESFQCLKGIYF